MDTLLLVFWLYLVAGIVFLGVYLDEILLLIEEAYRSNLWNEDEETATTNIEAKLTKEFGKARMFKMLTTIFMGHTILFTLYCLIGRNRKK